MGLIWDLEDPRLGIHPDSLALYLPDALPTVAEKISNVLLSNAARPQAAPKGMLEIMDSHHI